MGCVCAPMLKGIAAADAGEHAWLLQLTCPSGHALVCMLPACTKVMQRRNAPAAAEAIWHAAAKASAAPLPAVA